MFQQNLTTNPFQAYMASVEADVNIDIDVNEAEEEGGVPEEPLDTSETPEASELEVQDADAEVEGDDAVSDNVEDAVTSLESLYLTLDMVASQESTMSDSTFALMQLHLNTIGGRLGATAGQLVPSTESDDWFLQRDIVASQEAILDRIKEGTKEFGNTIRKMYESVKTYVKTLASHHDRTAKRLEKVRGALESGQLNTQSAMLSGRAGKRLAQGEQIADPATILQGVQQLAKLATQVLNDRKGVQIYASAASMIAKDGNIDEARISSELQKAYPALKVAADENGNVPLMIGNTAVFMTKGKGEADGLVRLGFKNGAAKVTGQRGFKAAAKSGAEAGKMAADAIGNSKAAGFAKKAIVTSGKVGGAVTGGMIGAATGAGVGALGGAVGAGVGALGGVAGGGVVGKKAGGAIGRGANKLYGAVGTKALQGAGAVAGAIGGSSKFDVTPLTEQQAKAYLSAAEMLIGIVTKYEGDIEGRSATNEQISKLLDEATTPVAAEGEEVGKDALKANAKLRRALGKSWKKTLKTETKVAAWVLNTAGALISYVGGQVNERDEPDEAPEGGAAGGEE